MFAEWREICSGGGGGGSIGNGLVSREYGLMEGPVLLLPKLECSVLTNRVNRSILRTGKE